MSKNLAYLRLENISKSDIYRHLIVKCNYVPVITNRVDFFKMGVFCNYCTAWTWSFQKVEWSECIDCGCILHEYRMMEIFEHGGY